MTDRIIRLLFTLGVVAIPFDAIAGVGVLGELSDEASFYFFMPAILLHLASRVGGGLRGPAPAARLSFLAIVAASIGAMIAVNALLNLPGILDARFHERSGVAKLVTANLVLIYGVLLAHLAAATLPSRWDNLLLKPVAASAAACIAFGLFEGLARAGVVLPLYTALNGLVHAGSDSLVQSWDGSLNLKLLEGWDQRLRSVSFEPPAFGNFTGYAWPWLLCGMLATTGARRALHGLLLAAFTLLIIASEARTGQLLLGVNVAGFVALRFICAPPNGHPKLAGVALLATVGAGAVTLGLVVLLTRLSGLTANVVGGESVSDLTRFAYQVSAFAMFTDHPLIGVGIGQFAFHAIDFMPGWAYLSPEVAASMIQPAAPWPNTYSLYARLAAETGVLGLVGWGALWLATIVLVLRAGTLHARRRGALPVVTYPIALNCMVVLVSGITTDTFRTPMMWIGLGAAAALLQALSRRT